MSATAEIKCSHEGCSCTPKATDLRQLRCTDCGRYSSPFEWGGEWDGEMVDELIPGCWLTTGATCPECTEA